MLGEENSLDEFLRKPRGDKQWRLNISRNTLLAILFSLVLHSLILLIPKPKATKQEAVLPARELTISLAPPTPKKVIKPEIEKPEIVAETPPIKPAEPIKPPKKTTKPKVITQKTNKPATPPVFKVPEELVAKKETPEKTPEKPVEKTPDLSVPKDKPYVPEPEKAPTDMTEYIAQQKAKRAAAEESAANENAEAAARELGPSAEAKRDARIKQNFQNGTNGLFEILSLDDRNAHFSFLGWKGDFGTSKRSFYEVEAKPNQDVRLVMIRKMIGLIREHYQGDFNWQSQRQGRTIILSARVEDSEGLEEFLMIEFFGKNYKSAN
jgi:outer membrane biosynthesis protein TonB